MRVVENEGSFREYVKELSPDGSRRDWGASFLHAKPVTTGKIFRNDFDGDLSYIPFQPKLKLRLVGPSRPLLRIGMPPVVLQLLIVPSLARHFQTKISMWGDFKP